MKGTETEPAYAILMIPYHRFAPVICRVAVRAVALGFAGGGGACRGGAGAGVAAGGGGEVATGGGEAVCVLKLLSRLL